MQQWRQRIDVAKAAIACGLAANAKSDGFLDPTDFHELGLFAQIDLAQVLVGWNTTVHDHPVLRSQLESYLGISPATPRVKITTPIKDVAVGTLVVDHMFELDTKPNIDQLNDDHLRFFPLTIATLIEPLEIWLQQPGGSKSRRWAYLRPYVVGWEPVYHAVIVNRQDQVLTTYRLNGGLLAFNTKRSGLLQYAAYGGY